MNSSFAIDSVGIFDQNFNQIFVKARSIKVDVKEESKVMGHPVESGATITDHRVILPTQIEISFILASSDYLDVYREIRQNYLDASLLVVQTWAGVYENQLIASLPHQENPEMFSTLTVALTFRQVQFVVPQYGVVPRRKSNSSTVNRGMQQGTTATQSSDKGSTLHNIIGRRL